MRAGCPGGAEAAAGPQRAAVATAQHEGGERAAVEEVDADPVPAHGVGVQDLVAPLVVDPGAAVGRRDAAATLDGQGGAWPELRFAVVVAGLALVGPLAREAGVALQQQRLRSAAIVSSSLNPVAATTRAPARRPRGAATTAPRRTAASSLRGRAQRRRRRPGPARDALVVVVAPRAQVGQRGVREQQLPRREAARVVAAPARCGCGRR